MLTFKTLTLVGLAALLFSFLKLKLSAEDDRQTLKKVHERLEIVTSMCQRMFENRRDHLTKFGARVEQLEQVTGRLAEAARRIQETPEAKAQQAAQTAIQELVNGKS